MEHSSGFDTEMGDLEVEVSMTYWAGSGDQFPNDIEIVAVKVKGGIDIQEYISKYFLSIIECEASERAHQEWGRQTGKED